MDQNQHKSQNHFSLKLQVGTRSTISYIIYYIFSPPVRLYFHLATIDPFKEATRPAAEEAEKGANPCIGLTGKRLKKCKAVRHWDRPNNSISCFQKASGGGKQKKVKGEKKKDKKAKKAKKQLDKTLDFEIMEGMSKKDKKAYKKQKKQRALEMANGEFDQEQNTN